MIENLITSLVLTLIIELAVALILKIRGKEDIILVTLVNTFTNPIVVYILSIVALLNNSEAYLVTLLILETSAFLAEAKLYKRYLLYKNINPYKLSLILNLSSFGFGILIYLF